MPAPYLTTAVTRCFGLTTFSLILLTLTPATAAENSTTPEFDKNVITSKYYSEGANVADINGDGHIDVIYGPQWYEGPALKTAHTFYPGKEYPNDRGYADNFFTYTFDFNGDGRTDILTIGLPGTPSYWYANVEGAELWPRYEVLDTVDNESPTLADMDGDGIPELICIHLGKIGYAKFDPQQPKAVWNFRPVSTGTNFHKYTHGLGIGDINGDQLNDLVMAVGWWQQPDSPTAKGPWEFHPHQFGAAQGGAQMYVYDVDGDGSNDIITSLAAHEYGLGWYQQIKSDTGASSFEYHPIMGKEPKDNRYGVCFSQPHAIGLVDIDDDGLQDIITGKCYWAHNGNDPGAREPAVLYYFRLVRNEEGVQFVPHQIDNDSGVGRMVAVSDVNGDRLIDVLVGNKKGCHLFTQRTGTANSTE